MKRKAQLLTLLMAILYSVSAMAVVDPYEVMTITPAEGEVESLQHFTVAFDGLPITVKAGSIPTLQKGGGSTVEGTMKVDESGTTLLIDFEQCFTASGQYYLSIPEGVLTVNGQRMLPLTFRFSIMGTMESFYDQITIDPAEGEVESLEVFTVSFPEYVGEIAYGKQATLTNTTSGKTYQAEMYDVGFKVMIYLSKPVNEAGEYTLTIPAGAVVFYTMAEEVRELTFNYTISGESIEAFYDQITIDPAEGMVESLHDFTITFPKTIDCLAPDVMASLTNKTTGVTHEVAMGFLDNKVWLNVEGEEITEKGQYTLTIPVGAVIIDALGEEVRELNFHYTIAVEGMPDYTINPPEGEVYLLQYFTISYSGQRVQVNEEMHPILTNDETGEEFLCNLLEIGGNAVVYKEYPLSVLGSYTLTIPAHCITIESTSHTNPEMTFHYVLAEKEVFIPPVIEDQPEGELKLYQRTGGLVREVEKEGVADDDNPYEIVYEEQTGALSIVFAPDGKVYIQHPVSWSYYYGWVEGTLSEDGKTITVPMGQYVAYARSLEMAVQVAMFRYDGNLNSYVYDDSVTELTYTINDDGSITQNGTSENLILGTMNRAFGQNFQYLDFEWLQAGDYESVFLPVEGSVQTPPEEMTTESYHLTTAINDGMDWEPYAATVKMGFNGDDVWLQGISEYLPNAWIKGVRQGDSLIFSNPQLLGTYEALFYFKCADFNLVSGETTQKDMVLTLTGKDTYTTLDYVFITVDKDQLYYVNYYQGLTISKQPDTNVKMPLGLETQEYTFSYKTLFDANQPMAEGHHSVFVGFQGNDVYITGLWPKLPRDCVKGELVDGKIVMNLPQFMNLYEEEYMGKYPIYLSTFDQSTGRVMPQIVFDYNEQTKSFGTSAQPLSISINKTGYLSLQDYYNMQFTPVDSSVEDVKADASGPVEYYDLQGHKLTDISNARGIIIVKNPDGTAYKMLKR